jgi:predicted AAA+ superfamily ATPase
MYKDKIKEIILEEKDEKFGDLVPRAFELQTLPGKALILTGVRRSGKSTLLRQHMRTQKLPYFYVNFSDERIAAMPAKDLGLTLEAYYEMEGGSDEKGISIGFDEIQIVEGWEKFIDRLLRNKLFNICITGSSAKMLSQDIATEMRGRSLSYEFFPLSFSEYIFPMKINLRKITTRERSQLTTLSKRYLVEGGFPETRHLAKEMRNRILQEYYGTIFYKDVVERHNPHNTFAVSACLKLMMNQTACLYSISKIVNKCKSLGISVSKADVSNFIKWFEDCYLLFSVPVFAESINRQMTNPRKIYCIDNGLVVANQSGISANTGHLLENLVFNCLRRKTKKIFYFKGQQEVDFVVEMSDQKLMIIQVCESLQDAATRKRELESTREAMGTLGVKKSWLVTIDEKGIENNLEGEIRIIPLWEFSLMLEG